jgi:hypothetical protein
LQVKILEPADVVGPGRGVDEEEAVADLVQHLMELVAQRLLHYSTTIDESLPGFGQQVDIEGRLLEVSCLDSGLKSRQASIGGVNDVLERRVFIEEESAQLGAKGLPQGVNEDVVAELVVVGGRYHRVAVGKGYAVLG